MINPSLDDLLKNTDSRYTLVIQVAKRARQLAVDPKQAAAVEVDKPVLKAIHEVRSGSLRYRRLKEGIK